MGDKLSKSARNRSSEKESMMLESPEIALTQEFYMGLSRLINKTIRKAINQGFPKQTLLNILYVASLEALLRVDEEQRDTAYHGQLLEFLKAAEEQCRIRADITPEMPQ
jgi:hypothetical protein